MRVLRYKKCGKKNCICHTRGVLHGPYVYERYRENGKEKWVYLGVATPKVIKEIERDRAWKKKIKKP